MQRRKIFWVIAAILTVVFTSNIYSDMKNNSCVTKTETRLVRGGSMAGLIDDGKKVKILYGYYDCNPVERGNVILYNYPGNPNPIIKSVRGLPGDTFSVENNIILNGQPLTNDNGQPYKLDEQEGKLLELYEKDYHGRIPPDTYLILGNITYGSLDSTKFGLVGGKDVLGKVVY